MIEQPIFISTTDPQKAVRLLVWCVFILLASVFLLTVNINIERETAEKREELIRYRYQLLRDAEQKPEEPKE